MRAFRSDFAFIGERNYVHGPTIFEAFLGRVRESANAPASGAASVRLLRINRTIHANGDIVVAPAREPRPDWGRPCAEMSCMAGGHAWSATFFDRNPVPIARRTVAREKDFVRAVRLSAPFCGGADLDGIGDEHALFEALVEANKQIHLLTLTGNPVAATPKFRFAYCLDYDGPPSLVARDATVQVRGEGLRKTGGHEFSLTTLEFRSGDTRSRFKLCFARKDAG